MYRDEQKGGTCWTEGAESKNDRENERLLSTEKRKITRKKRERMKERKAKLCLMYGLLLTIVSLNMLQAKQKSFVINWKKVDHYELPAQKPMHTVT